MNNLCEIPPSLEVEILADSYAIHSELQTAIASAKELRGLLARPDGGTDDARLRQALLLQIVILLARAVISNGKRPDSGRHHPLPSSIFNSFENGSEAWEAFKVLRDKILIHDEAPAFQIKVGAMKIGEDIALGQMTMVTAFEHDPHWVDMLGQMTTHALAATEERIRDLETIVREQLAGWDAKAAPSLRIVVPSKDDLKKSRRNWEA